MAFLNYTKQQLKEIEQLTDTKLTKQYSGGYEFENDKLRLDINITDINITYFKKGGAVRGGVPYHGMQQLTEIIFGGNND